MNSLRLHADDANSGGGIPKIIHQTFGPGPPPKILQDNISNIEAMNPTWHHAFYDDAAAERFIEENYGNKILEYYRRIEPSYGAARADLFRYLLLYRVGGVYLDIKSTTLRPLDDVLRDDDRYVLSHWNNLSGERSGWGIHPELAGVARGEYQQWHIICAPGHPFLKAVIERVLRNIDAYRPWREHLGQYATVRVTGPMAYTKAIFPIIGLHPHRIVQDERSLGLEYTVLTGSVHSQLFPNHYVTLEHPMISSRGIVWMATQLYRAARAVRNRGRGLLGHIRARLGACERP